MLDPQENIHNTAYSVTAKKKAYSAEQPGNKQRNGTISITLEKSFTEEAETSSKASHTRRSKYDGF